MDEGYHHVPHPEEYWKKHRSSSPTMSELSSACSAQDCEECAYTEERRQFSSRSRTRNTNAVPYVVVPGNKYVPRITPPPICPHLPTTHSGAYIHNTSREYRLSSPAELDRHIAVPPRTGESSLVINNTSLVADSQNQVALYQGTATSSNSDALIASDGTSMVHSDESSPQWSLICQRHISGSEEQSDVLPNSPMTASLGGLYENRNPVFRHAHSPSRGHSQRPVIITRSNDEHESRHHWNRDRYDELSDASSSDGSYSRREGSFSSSERSENYRREYARRYW
jgi:hypothetical protein